MPRKECKLSKKNLAMARVRAIRARKDGARICDIAHILGVHPNSVSRWVARYNSGGAMKLRAVKATGRPPKVNCKELFPKITRLVRRPATSFGFDTPLWTSKRIWLILKTEIGISVGASTVRKMLCNAGLSYQKPERRAFEQNPTARKEWITKTWPDLKKMAKKQRAVILFGDEASVSLNPTSGKTWSRIGKTPVINSTSRRGSIAVISAITPTGKLFFTLPKKHVDSDEFIKFLKKILLQIPRKKIYMVLDNCSSHKSRKTKEFISNIPRIELHYLPSYSPDFNPDELTWARLKGVEMIAHQARNKDDLRSKTLGKMRGIQKNKAMIKNFFKNII